MCHVIHSTNVENLASSRNSWSVSGISASSSADFSCSHVSCKKKKLEARIAGLLCSCVGQVSATSSSCSSGVISISSPHGIRVSWVPLRFLGFGPKIRQQGCSRDMWLTVLSYSQTSAKASRQFAHKNLKAYSGGSGESKQKRPPKNVTIYIDLSIYLSNDRSNLI